MIPLLRVALVLLGAAACLIGALIFTMGGAWTADVFVSALSLFSPQPPATGLSDADTDSELRFYSALWFAYGVAMVAAAFRFPESAARVRVLLAIFFAGGVGRLASLLAMGPPHLLFQTLMWIELIAAPVLFGLTFAPRGHQQQVRKSP